MKFRYVTIACLVLGAILLAESRTGFWYRLTGPAVPLPDTTGADPLVARTVDVARRNVVRRPGSGQEWGVLGEVLRIHEFLPESTVAFLRAAQLNPRDPRWPYFLGDGVRTTDPQAAIAYLRRSSELAGSAASPRLLLGEILIEQGRVDEAEPVLARVLEHEPDSPRALLAMGRIALSRGKFEEAVHQLKRTVELAPKVKSVRSLLSAAYARLGETASADHEARAAAALPEAPAWSDPYQDELYRLWVGQRAALTRVRDMWREGRQQETIALLREVVKAYPDSDAAQFTLGDRLNRVLQYAEAEGPLRESVRLNPRYGSAQLALGLSLFRQGKIPEAVEHFQGAVRVEPRLATAHYFLSLGLRAQGKSAAAIAALKTAIGYDPEMVAAYRQLGTVLAESGRYAEAREALKRADEVSRSKQQSATQDQLPEPTGSP